MAKTISDQELERYNRHIILTDIGIEGQTKIKNARVLVVGAGGLGSPALRYLTAAGIGHIGIVDDDVVSESNLQRQILYDTPTVGQSKAEVAKKSLSALNPYSEFELFKTRFTPQNAIEIATGYDIILDCTDNFDARYTINNASRELGIPMVHGAIFKFSGQVSVFNYQGGPAYDHLFPDTPPVNTAPDALGVLGVLPGVVGSLQSNEVLKIILGIGDVLTGKLLLIDLKKVSFQVLTL